MLARFEIPEELIKSIKPLDLVNYFTVFNWSLLDEPNSNFYKLTNKYFPNTYVKIPKNQFWDDYSPLLLEAINQIASYEKRPAISIIQDLKIRYPGDIVNFSLQGEETEDGTTSLEMGMTMYESGMEAILSSAISVFDNEPKKYYSGKYPLEIRNFEESIRIAQPDFGSFISRFIVPTHNSQTSQRLLSIPNKIDDGLGRKSTTNLVKSINYIVDNIQKKDMNRIINPELEDPVINSNLCDSIYGMRPAYKESDIQISVKYCNAQNIERNLLQATVYGDLFDAFNVLSKELKPPQDTTERTFTGEVYGLHKYSRLGEPLQGFVYLNIIENDKLIKAKVWLTKEDYARAIQAHQNQVKLKLTGILNKAPKISTIENSGNLEYEEE